MKTVLHLWLDEVVEEHERQAEAENLAAQQRIRKEHDDKTRFILLRMDGESEMFVMQQHFDCWRDLIGTSCTLPSSAQ
jgi:hypothetical protein